MMFARYAKHAMGNHMELGLPEAWLIGAKTALAEMKHLKFSKEWMQFYSEVESFVNWWDDIDPISPENALLNRYLQGSLFDYIGGYVSVAGTLTDIGIKLGIAGEYHSDLLMLLSDLVVINNDDVLVLFDALQGFLNLVTIIGPLFDDIMEALP